VATERQPHGEEDGEVAEDPWATAAERQMPSEEGMEEIHDLWAQVAELPPTGRGRRSTTVKAGPKNVDAGTSVDDPWANASLG
jgi:hypothetical protein